MHSLLRRLLLAGALAAYTATAATSSVTAPTITKQPVASQVVIVGTKASFSVTAIGTAPLKYQWMLNGTNITGSAATRATYGITKTTIADAGNYTVFIYNSAGNITSNTSFLMVSPNYPGRYNVAVVNYNPLDVANETSGNVSGGAVYGPASISSAKMAISLNATVEGVVGNATASQSNLTASVSPEGVVLFNGTYSNLTVNMVTSNGTLSGTPIGFVGKGILGNSTNDAFVLGLNATTTAPSNVTACVGNYTVVVLYYNGTAVLKKNPALNQSGLAEIGTGSVITNGTVSVSLNNYATGGTTPLGGNATVYTGTVSKTGVLTLTGLPGLKAKFVTLNKQVIGFQGFIYPSTGQTNYAIIIGILGTFTPLSPAPPPVP